MILHQCDAVTSACCHLNRMDVLRQFYKSGFMECSEFQRLSFLRWEKILAHLVDLTVLRQDESVICAAANLCHVCLDTLHKHGSGNFKSCWVADAKFAHGVVAPSVQETKAGTHQSHILLHGYLFLLPFL